MKFLHLLFVLVLFGFNSYGATGVDTPKPRHLRSDDGQLFHIEEESNLKNAHQYFYEGEIESNANYSMWMLTQAKKLKELADKVKLEGKKLGLIIGRGNREQQIPDAVSSGTVWVYNSNNGENQDRTSSIPHIYGDLTKGLGYALSHNDVRFDTIMTDWEVPKFFKTYDLLLLVQNLLGRGGTFVTSMCKGWKYRQSDSLNFDYFKMLPTSPHTADVWYAVTYRAGEEIKVDINRVSHSGSGTEIPRPAGDILALSSLKLKKSLTRANVSKTVDYEGYEKAMLEQSADLSSTAWVFVEVLKSLAAHEKISVLDTTTTRILSELLGPSFESCHVERGEYPYPGNVSKDPEYEYEQNKIFSSIHCRGFKGRIETLP